MAKMFVDGDSETLDRITAALRAAGLSVVDVEPMARLRGVAPFPAAHVNWSALADLGADLPYAEWREEVLSLVDAEEPATLRNALWLCDPVPPALRRAG
jgi:hypothetical protein